MASAWIRQITNSTQHTLQFILSDPMMHPTIEQSHNVRIVEQGIQNPQGNVQVQSGQTIEVGPGGSLTASWFAIPWQGYGTLVFKNGNRKVTFTTGPKNGIDYLIVNDSFNETLRIGNQHGWQNLELSININEQGEPVWTVGNMQDFDFLKKPLYDLGRWLLDQLLGPRNQNS